MKPYRASDVKETTAALKAIANDLPHAVESRIVSMLECYAADLDAKETLERYLETMQARMIIRGGKDDAAPTA